MISVNCPFCDKENEIEIEIDIIDCSNYTSINEEENCIRCNSTFSFDVSVDFDISVYNIKKEKCAIEEAEPIFKDKYTKPLFEWLY